MTSHSRHFHVIITPLDRAETEKGLSAKERQRDITCGKLHMPLDTCYLMRAHRWRPLGRGCVLPPISIPHRDWMWACVSSIYACMLCVYMIQVHTHHSCDLHTRTRKANVRARTPRRQMHSRTSRQAAEHERIDFYHAPRSIARLCARAALWHCAIVFAHTVRTRT